MSHVASAATTDRANAGIDSVVTSMTLTKHVLLAVCCPTMNSHLRSTNRAPTKGAANTSLTLMTVALEPEASNTVTKVDRCAHVIIA